MNKAKEIIPFHEQILLEEIPPSNTIGGGIIIVPEAHKHPVNQGIVMDKGPLVSDKIIKGEIVFFPLHSESRLEFAGRKFILVPESQCLGAIRDAKIIIK